jgi:hypothetical protein
MAFCNEKQSVSVEIVEQQENLKRFCAVITVSWYSQRYIYRCIYIFFLMDVICLSIAVQYIDNNNLNISLKFIVAAIYSVSELPVIGVALYFSVSS